jgi:hypothetical protein
MITAAIGEWEVMERRLAGLTPASTRCPPEKAPQGRKPHMPRILAGIALQRPGSASDVSNRSNQGVSLVHRLSAHQQIDFETLYQCIGRA